MKKKKKVLFVLKSEALKYKRESKGGMWVLSGHSRDESWWGVPTQQRCGRDRESAPMPPKCEEYGFESPSSSRGTIQLSVHKEILYSLQFPGLFPRHITASTRREERLQSVSLNNLLYSQEKFYPKGKIPAPQNAIKCSHLHRDVHSNSATSTHLRRKISWLAFSKIFSARGYFIRTKTFEVKQ